MRFTIWVVVFLFGGASAVAAQSLAEMAEKEKKRRKAVQGSGGKVITEKDLGRNSRLIRRPSETAASEDSSGESSSESGQEEKTDAEIREEKRVEIQGKIDEARTQIATVQQRMDAAQNELNDLSDMTFGPRRGGLMKIIEDGKVEIAGLEQQIEGFREEARRAAVRVN